MLSLLLLSSLLAGPPAAPPPSRTNVVVLVADDLGWTGLGCYGSDLYETPSLDRLAADPGETHDLAAERPEQARELRDRLAAWRASVSAQMPKPNPQFDPRRQREVGVDPRERR